jgi:hypothetical protein
MQGGARLTGLSGSWGGSVDRADKPGGEARVAEPGLGLPGEHVHFAGPQVTDMHDDRLCRAGRSSAAGVRTRGGSRGRGGSGAGKGADRGNGQARTGKARRTVQDGSPGRPWVLNAFCRAICGLIRVDL